MITSKWRFVGGLSRHEVYHIQSISLHWVFIKKSYLPAIDKYVLQCGFRHHIARIEAIEKKKSKLVDMRLEDIIDSDTYESKFSSMTTKQEDLIKERIQLQETVTNEKDIKRRLRDFKKTLEQNEVLNEFDRYVFESIVEKVIVGGYDEDGNIDPAQLVFVYKTGFKNNLDGNRFKPERKNARANRKSKNLYSHTNDENQSLCSDTKADTCRDCGEIKKKIVSSDKE